MIFTRKSYLSCFSHPLRAGAAQQARKTIPPANTVGTTEIMGGTKVGRDWNHLYFWHFSWMKKHLLYSKWNKVLNCSHLWPAQAGGVDHSTTSDLHKQHFIIHQQAENCPGTAGKTFCNNPCEQQNWVILNASWRSGKERKTHLERLVEHRIPQAAASSVPWDICTAPKARTCQKHHQAW